MRGITGDMRGISQVNLNAFNFGYTFNLIYKLLYMLVHFPLPSQNFQAPYCPYEFFYENLL